MALDKAALELARQINYNATFEYNEKHCTAFSEGVQLTDTECVLVRDQLVHHGYLICDPECKKPNAKRGRVYTLSDLFYEKYGDIVLDQADVAGYDPGEDEFSEPPTNDITVPESGELELALKLAALVRSNPGIGTSILDGGDGWRVIVTNESDHVDTMMNLPDPDVRLVEALSNAQVARDEAIEEAKVVDEEPPEARAPLVEPEVPVDPPPFPTVPPEPVVETPPVSKKSPEAGNYFPNAELPVEEKE